MTTDLWIDIFGYGGLLVNLISLLAKSCSRLLYLQMLSNALVGVHYYLLNATAGLIAVAIAVVRNFIFTLDDRHRWLHTPIVPGLVILISILATIPTWQGWSSLLPVAGLALGTIGRYFENMTKLLVFGISATFFVLFYGILIQSLPVIISQVLQLFISFYALYQLDKKSGGVLRNCEWHVIQ